MLNKFLKYIFNISFSFIFGLLFFPSIFDNGMQDLDTYFFRIWDSKTPVLILVLLFFSPIPFIVDFIHNKNKKIGKFFIYIVILAIYNLNSHFFLTDLMGQYDKYIEFGINTSCIMGLYIGELFFSLLVKINERRKK